MVRARSPTYFDGWYYQVLSAHFCAVLCTVLSSSREIPRSTTALRTTDIKISWHRACPWSAYSVRLKDTHEWVLLISYDSVIHGGEEEQHKSG